MFKTKLQNLKNTTKLVNKDTNKELNKFNAKREKIEKDLARIEESKDAEVSAAKRK